MQALQPTLRALGRAVVVEADPARAASPVASGFEGAEMGGDLVRLREAELGEYRDGVEPVLACFRPVPPVAFGVAQDSHSLRPDIVIPGLAGELGCLRGVTEAAASTWPRWRCAVLSSTRMLPSVRKSLVSLEASRACW